MPTEFINRLKYLIETLGFKDRQLSKFAREIGASRGYLGDVLQSRSNPSFGIISGIASRFPSINIRWLLTGEGEPVESPSGLLVDPERIELLRKVCDILDSGGGSYAASLTANINSFHEAISTARKLDVMEDKIAEIEKAIRINAGRTRKGDPPEKKEEIISERAISSG